MTKDEYLDSNNDAEVTTTLSSVDDTISISKKPTLPTSSNQHYLKWVTKDNDGNKATVHLYGTKTSCLGSKIRHAITNLQTEYNVGSKYEYQFFKVTFALGYDNRKEPLTLFFDSPEQYERHCFVTLNQQIKRDWHAKH